MQETPKSENNYASNGIYLLCVPKGWESYISREFYELQQGLVDRGWTRLIIDEVEDTVIVAAIERARIVLLWEAYELLERNSGRLCENSSRTGGQATRIFFCDDVHYFTSHRREQRLRSFLWADLILATYPDKLHEWFPEVDRHKSRWVPHSAASYFQKPPTSLPSSDRILLSGSRTWPYPFRQFCQAKLSRSVCDVIDHPGYPGYPGDKANTMQSDSAAMQRLGREQYATLLQTYPIMLVCGSIFGYLVAKVFEGMAMGCITICERASLGKRLLELGFVEGEHYFGTDLQSVIEDASAIRDAFLRGDLKLTNMANTAALKVSNEHTTHVRAAQIHRICMEKVAV